MTHIHIYRATSLPHSNKINILLSNRFQCCVFYYIQRERRALFSRSVFRSSLFFPVSVPVLCCVYISLCDTSGAVAASQHHPHTITNNSATTTAAAVATALWPCVVKRKMISRECQISAQNRARISN